MIRFLILILSLLSLLSCYQSVEKKDIDDKPQKDHFIYIWQDKKLQRLTSWSNRKPASWLAWSEKDRLVDIIESDNDIWGLANHYGLINIKQINQDLEFSYFPDILFTERSAVNMFRYGGKINIHIYYNTVFGHSKPHLDRVNWLQFSNGQYSVRPLPFIVNNAEEMTGLVQRQSGDWAIEVKRNQRDRIYFDYFLYHPGLEQFKSISISEYRASYDFILPPEAPRIYTELIAKLNDFYGKSSVEHLTIRSKDQKAPERYQIGSTRELLSGNSELKEILAYALGNSLFIYLPEGRVIFLYENGSVSDFYSIPNMPSNIGITNIIWNEQGYYLLWEEQDFYKVGNSGIIYLPYYYFDI
ncbi:hypothetical protein [Spirochaeta cellobiosiphila]|uniref:hypothetical protein n=1 Tax=Spirochaeta cellobiosiphila TaxID=504483 RepID=UPI00040BB05A|nr:hypothetical protein [Spirochaeta cellobiosiphila]